MPRSSPTPSCSACSTPSSVCLKSSERDSTRLTWYSVSSSVRSISSSSPDQPSRCALVSCSTMMFSRAWQLHAHAAAVAELRVDVDGAAVARRDFLRHRQAEAEVMPCRALGGEERLEY